jgi:hypothetical protein
MTLSLDTVLSLPRIGSGNFRHVYRDGPTVYKIEYGEGIDLQCNQAEVDNLDRLRAVRLPRKVALPDAYLYVTDGVPVVSMEYIEGEPMGECFCIPGEAHEGCLPPGMERDLNALGIDCAYGNIILSDSTYWLIDLDADLR